jgi:hypothetical protein
MTKYGINFINRDGASTETSEEYATLEEAVKDYNAWNALGNYAEIWQIDENNGGSHVFRERYNHHFTKVVSDKNGSKWS